MEELQPGISFKNLKRKIEKSQHLAEAVIEQSIATINYMEQLEKQYSHKAVARTDKDRERINALNAFLGDSVGMEVLKDAGKMQYWSQVTGKTTEELIDLKKGVGKE